MQSQENPPDTPVIPLSFLESQHIKPLQKSSFDNTPSKRNVREDRRKTIADLRQRFKLDNLNPIASNSLADKVEKGEEEFKLEEGAHKSNIRKSRKFQDLFKPLEVIGEGSTAVVKKIERIENGEILVAKIVRSQDPEDHDQLRKEYNILAKIQHKNIIKVEDLLLDTQTGTSQIIMEYVPGSTLLQMIVKKKKIEESQLKVIIEQVVNALEYLHSKGVCHRDVTPSNILVTDNNEVKLIDFSVAKIFRADLWSPKAIYSATTNKKKHPTVIGTFMISDAGTDAYKAPEIVKGIPYGQAVDMWSMGCVTFYALVGHKPFYSKEQEKLNELILNNKFRSDPAAWEKISYEAKIFVSSCLNKFPFFRLRPKEAQRHPWIKGIVLRKDCPDKTASKRRFSPQPVRKKLIHCTKVQHDSLTGPLPFVN